MTKILIIVHVEPMFASLLFDLEHLAEQIAKHAVIYDRVINVSCEELLGSNRAYTPLESFEQRDWLWGFDPNNYEGDLYWVEGVTYIPTGGHDYSEILPWMKELPRDADYTLVGGGRNECLRDIDDIWVYLGYKVRVNEELTY